jgi:hypothetical protein
MLPSALNLHLADMVALSRRLSGHLTDREVRFLALAAATLPPSLGDVLEIGSFKGKSTTVLAKSVTVNGGNRVVAVDPLTLLSPTDPSIGCPESLPDLFWETLEANGVRHLVEFYQLRSEELALTWNRPLRLLWIDGDHTYQGATADIDNFAHHLRPGSVVAFHDVLNGFDGPIRAFCERVLLSPAFGSCGVCGSIGWAQYVGGASHTKSYSSRKLKLYRKLSRLLPFVSLDSRKNSHPLLYKVMRILYKVMRTFVPHGDIDPNTWKEEIGKNLAIESGG